VAYFGLVQKKSRNERSPISQEQLQSAITEAVRNADLACETFAGVIVQRETPKERFDVNWQSEASGSEELIGKGPRKRQRPS
jgi:hypothetical protein